MEANWIMANPQNLAAIFATLVVGAWVVAIVMTGALPEPYRQALMLTGTSSGPAEQLCGEAAEERLDLLFWCGDGELVGLEKEPKMGQPVGGGSSRC